MTHTQLILGGARSGKSRYAEQCAQALRPSRKRLYVATATAGDDEMSDRIQQHQERRDEQWQLIEEPIHLANVLDHAQGDSVILIDCLTLWLSNCLHEKCWVEQRDAFLRLLSETQANVIMVSNEVGSGIVPMGELSRQFVDQSGWLHQEIASVCTHVNLVVAGLPLALKGTLLEL